MNDNTKNEKVTRRKAAENENVDPIKDITELADTIELVEDDHDEDDFIYIPGYGEMPSTKTVKSKNEQEELIDIIQNAALVEYSPEIKEQAKTLMSARFEKALEISENGKLKILSLKDFGKRDRVDRRKVMTLPMPNSHFMVDIRGFGATDFARLYGQNPDTYTHEYEKELYRSQISMIINSTPLIPNTELTKLIHYNDMDAITLGILIGSNKKVNYLVKCENPECPIPDFTVESNPVDLILNYDEVEKWVEEMSKYTVFEDVVTNSRVIEKPIDVLKDDGLIFYYKEMTLPEYNKFTKKFESCVSKSNEVDKQKLRQLGPILAFMTKIDDFVIGGSAVDFDTKMAILDQLDTDQLSAVSEAFQKEMASIRSYKIGLRNIKCPNCGNVHDEIIIPSAQSLAFFHLLVSGILSQKTATSENK